MSSTNKTNYSYTKSEIDSMGGGSSLSDTISQKADKSDLSGYLPLSGGQITGTTISRNVDNEFISLCSAQTGQGGARLDLIAKDYPNYKGYFSLNATDGTDTSVLVGTPDGELTWDRKNVDTIEEQGSNYIRYSSGLQICWGGEVSSPTTFPRAFNEQPTITLTHKTVSGVHVNNTVSNASASSFEFISYLLENSVSVNTCANYIAIGRWK